jgi:hypothetical protein
MNKFNEERKREGYWEIHWHSGKLHFRGNYLNGKKIGYWEYYDLFLNGVLNNKEYFLY